MWENSTKLPDDPPLVCLGQIRGTKLMTGSVRASHANSILNCKDDKLRGNTNSKKQIFNGIFSSYFLTSFRKPVSALYLKTVHILSKLVSFNFVQQMMTVGPSTTGVYFWGLESL